jgi:hypothetical protein
MQEAVGHPSGEEPPRQPIRLQTFPGNGLQPGIDLESTDSVLDLMESL